MYEFFILVEGKEVTETAEVDERIVESKKQHLVNEDETWIQSTINLKKAN